MDFIPDAPTILNVKDKIRHAFQKSSMLHGSLLQFWAPTTTMEGRTLLTTQNQPFALSRTTCMSDRRGLCDYRLVSKEYKFYADAESGEEELGLPGRVFLQKLPESAPSVKYYSEKEYPQRNLALRCNINGSWALPVFEHSSHTCVGVLEIVSLYYSTSYWHDKYFLNHLYDVFQEFGLQCFDEYTHCKMRYRNENKALTDAFRELRMVFGSVCKIHKLPLALTWVSCSTCNDLLPVKLPVTGVEYFEEGNGCLTNFLEVSKGRHLRKGQVMGRILPFPNLLYCSDIKEFSIAEYPFLPYARQCKLSGWFAICLQSIYTGNEVYVLEFFLPVRSKDDENILSTLSLILGTMEEHFDTFKLASGQELVERLSLEVIHFQNGQKSHSIHTIQATRISRILELLKDGGLMLQLGQLDQPSMDVINNGMNVVSEAQNHNLPILETLQNGNVAMQLDSSKQPSMDPLSIGQNVATAEQNIIAINGSEEGTRNEQQRELTKTGARIEISLEDILRCSKMSRNNAARKLEVGISTLRRVCRGHGINRWPPRDIKKVRSFRPSPIENQGQTPQLNYDLPSPIENQGQTPQLNYDLPSNQASASVVHRKAAFQDADMVTIRAKYDNSMIKFRLSLSSRLVVLQQEVAKRLNLDPQTYNAKYVDEENEVILIACDEDLQDCMHTSRSLGNTSIVVQLEPKQPITPVITGLNTANQAFV
ncbi:protein NLP7-like isoform X2 [Rhododendron vialii]|nr:protein NLP7-like isoform X2 [Rhododendron vialii]